MRRLTKEEADILEGVPDEWAQAPFRSSELKVMRMEVLGLLERRRVPLKGYPNWGEGYAGVVPRESRRREWRRTEAGRAALQAEKGEG